MEIEKLDAFDAAWAEVERVDQRLLAFAVANTNLKATRLSREPRAPPTSTASSTRSTRWCVAVAAPETLRALAGASIAALRIQSLAFVHIPSADDAEMTRLEERMRAMGEEVNRDLGAVRDSGQVSPDRLALATQAWSDYQTVLKKVLKLSRENTNVISFDVSVHEKREVTKECLAALSALLEAVNVGSKAR